MKTIVKKIKNYSTSSWLSLIGSMSSIAGLYFYFLDKNLNTSQEYTLFSFLFLCIGAFLLIMYYAIVYKIEYYRFKNLTIEKYDILEKINKSKSDNLTKIISRSENISSSIHKINHQYRNNVFKLDSLLEKTIKDIDVITDQTSFDRTKELFNLANRKIYLKFFHVLINEVKVQFDNYFLFRDIETTIRVSLKIVNPTNPQDIREWEVITVYRDQDTFNSLGLGASDDPHLIKDNTAFDSIAYHNKESFCSNDLQTLGDTYRNTSRKWEDQYNATIVVPIRFLPEKSKGQLILFGFLAVDSKNIHSECLFSSDRSSEHMSIIGGSADLCAAILKEYEKVGINISKRFEEKQKIINNKSQGSHETVKP